MSSNNEAWYAREGDRAISEDRSDEAVVIFKKGVGLFPTSKELQLGLARAHNRMGDYAAACAILEPLRKSNPYWDTVVGNLGKAYLNLGRFAEALSCIEAVTAAPDVSSEVVCNFAYMLKEHGRYEHSARLYQRATNLAPTCAEAWLGLGDSTHRLGKSQEAVVHLERAVELKPDYWKALSYLGHLLDDLKRLKESKAILDRIPPEEFHNAETIRKLIRMCWRPGDRAKRALLEKRLQKLEFQNEKVGIAAFIHGMDGRMEQASIARAKKGGNHRPSGGRFWTGEPTIVTQGCEAGFRLERLLGRVFDRPASFAGLDRARVVRLDHKLCQDIIEALAVFLEEYPWLCFLVDGRSDPPPFKVDDIFKESGATGLMFYGGEVLKAMRGKFKEGVIDRSALLRLERSAARLSKVVEPGREHYRAWIELTAALG